ncbi:unnamed protein product [Rotaria socialis]|uniref:Uncharacterized protein n=1 Tax=Rotaria socialis TaxID=392032 RepID=A0A818NMG5_9BILA|nr:unnamed protein product [Rotaria socialis]
MKLYLEEMPPSFHGKSFAESALVCFKLGVMLLAIEKERKDEYGNTRMAVDIVPCDDCIIIRGSRAFIVCMSSEDANRTIHDADVTQPLMTQQSERASTPCYQRSNTFLEEDMSSFDSTGMFYFTPSRNIQDAVLDVNSLREYHNIRHRPQTVQDDGIQCKHPLQFRDRT